MRQFVSLLLLSCMILPSVRAEKAGRTVSAVKDVKDVGEAGSRVVVRVGDDVLTGNDLIALTAFRSDPSMRKLSNAELDKLYGGNLLLKRSFSSDGVRKGLRAAFGPRVAAEFVKVALLVSYAREKGLAADADCRAAFKREVDRFVRTKEGREFREPLEKMAERQALAESARKAIMADFQYEPDPTVVSNVMQRVRIYNERIEATNQAVRVRAALASRAAACPNADFEAIAISNGVATSMSDMEWDPMDAETFAEEFPELYAVLGKRTTGAVSDAIEADNAMVVGKLVLKTEPTEDDPALYRIACMRFPFAAKAKATTFEETKAELIGEKRRAYFNEALERIYKNVKVTIDNKALLHPEL